MPGPIYRFPDDFNALPQWVALELLVSKKLRFPEGWQYSRSWKTAYNTLVEVVSLVLDPFPHFRSEDEDKNINKWWQQLMMEGESVSANKQFFVSVVYETHRWLHKNVLEATSYESQLKYMMLCGFVSMARHCQNENVVRDFRTSIFQGRSDGSDGERVWTAGYLIREARRFFGRLVAAENRMMNEDGWLSETMEELTGVRCGMAVPRKARENLNKGIDRLIERRLRLAVAIAEARRGVRHEMDEATEQNRHPDWCAVLQDEQKVDIPKTLEWTRYYAPESDEDYFMCALYRTLFPHAEPFFEGRDPLIK